MFDLHKREMDENDPDNDEEVISVAYFLEVRLEPVQTGLDQVLTGSDPVLTGCILLWLNTFYFLVLDDLRH